jgi:hypothetical protein
MPTGLVDHEIKGDQEGRMHGEDGNAGNDGVAPPNARRFVSPDRPPLRRDGCRARSLDLLSPDFFDLDFRDPRLPEAVLRLAEAKADDHNHGHPHCSLPSLQRSMIERSMLITAPLRVSSSALF